MSRQPLTDGSGRWFDYDKATKFEESEYWNGNNHISHATGSQWEHEALYRTATCKWILNHWSQWQGTGESYELITRKEAATWLVINRHPDTDCAAEEMRALEIV